MSKLPRAEAAFIEAGKIRDYLLAETHPQNGGKAAFFGAFGLDTATWPLMRDALARHPIQNEVVAPETSRYGTKYVVRCRLETPDDRNPCITTIWIIVDDAAPRLVTAYP